MLGTKCSGIYSPKMANEVVGLRVLAGEQERRSASVSGGVGSAEGQFR